MNENRQNENRPDEAGTVGIRPGKNGPDEAGTAGIRPGKNGLGKNGLGENGPDENGSGESKQKFIKSDKYFTISIYVFLTTVACAVAIRAIFYFSATRAFFSGLLRAISPFLIALLIAYILTPFVRVVNKFLKKIFKRLPDKPRMVMAMLIVYLISIGLVISILVYVLPAVVQNLGDLISKVPAQYRELKTWIKSLQEQFPAVDFTSVTDMLDSTQSDVMTSLRDISGRIIPVLYTASVSVVTWLANFLIALVVSVYMLYGRKSLLRILKIMAYALLPKSKVPVVAEIVCDCNRIFSKFVVSKMIDSLIIGVLCAILMTILRLPYVFLISVFVGVTNMIPYFGPFIGAIPGIVIMLVISPVKALIFAVMILCLQQFDGLWLGPKLMGSSTGMKPIWIIFAITIGGKFFGVPGMFLGVPVVAIIAYLAERYMRYRLEKKGLDMDRITV